MRTEQDPGLLSTCCCVWLRGDNAGSKLCLRLVAGQAACAPGSELADLCVQTEFVFDSSLRVLTCALMLNKRRGMLTWSAQT